MVEGIPPREASDRLNIFQSRFDELWRKFQTYSDGEDLFGLPVTDYGDLQRIRKELNLAQKLYGLYNAVMDIMTYCGLKLILRKLTMNCLISRIS